MLFHNTTDRLLKFQIGERRYAVPPNGEVSIPSRFHYVPASRGLPLAEGPSPLGTDAPHAQVDLVDDAPPARRPAPPEVDGEAEVEGESAASHSGSPDDGDDVEQSVAAAAAKAGRPPRTPRRAQG